MYCQNCGNKIKDDYEFCIECGHNTANIKPESALSKNLNQKWWYRLAKVVHIFLYVPLLSIIVIVWTSSSSTYNYYTNSYTDTPGTAFWYSLLTLVIGVVIIKLIKITFLYVAFGQKPQWKKEVKKFF